MTTRLLLLPHLQQWDGAALTLRLLMVPRGSPLDSLDQMLAGSPSFASASFKLDVHLISGLDALPQLSGTAFTSITPPSAPRAHEIFTALASQFDINPLPAPVPPRPAGTGVFKHLPTSYQKAVNFSPGSFSNVFTDSTYSCAIKAASSNTPKILPPPDPRVPWGQVIAIVLRNPMLAELTGLIRTIVIPVSNPDLLKDGAYVYLTLSSSSDARGLLTQSDALKVYASRIPFLRGPQRLFTPVLFPVLVTPKSFNYDEVFQEVDDYSDGWAKAVHCAQPQQLHPNDEEADGSRPVSELGIRLGWDDEQVAKWMNRQLDTSLDDLDCPLGVTGYRIDAQLQNTTTWHSLVRAEGEMGVGNLDIGKFAGEVGIETHCTQLQANREGMYWLPVYFCAWNGPAMATLDELRLLLNGGPDKRSDPGIKGVVPDLQLQYGKTYNFRVRMKDHTGGGPTGTDNPILPGPSRFTSCDFRRWIRPLEPIAIDPPSSEPDPVNPPTVLKFSRPLLSYPAANCTDAYSNVNDLLLADLPAATLARRKPGVADPDVDRVEIVIEVAGLVQDPATTDGSFMPVATTSRTFPPDPSLPVVLTLTWSDMPDISTLQHDQSPTGAVVLPRGRTLRLRIGSLCKEDSENSYFGDQDVRRGPTKAITLRSNPSQEKQLFVDELPSEQIRAVYMQPESPVNAAVLAAQQAAGRPNERLGDNASRLAAALGLSADGLTLRAQFGQRVVFGCSSGIHHAIGPDLASIRFGSESDLALHWIIAIKMTINRDWSWDGLLPDGVAVQRDAQQVGRFAPNRSISAEALVQPRRSQTQLVFFDAVDPKAVTGDFPKVLEPKYMVSWELAGSPTSDPPLTVSLKLPVTTPPAQIPKIVSAGIAMSEYQRDQGTYTSSKPRQRMLWIELDAPPADDNDSYFARVLRNAPDPLLTDTGFPGPERAEPPLAIDPEPIRVITPDQSDDRAGLDAMQAMVAADGSDKIHWMMPLPPGLTETSPELFGFFKYELRVGHAHVWSTAQGRFGAPLQIAGVQHPPPPLPCNVIRTHAGITATAPFALPVLDGVPIQPAFEKSQIWIMLYAQVAQLDGKDCRNLLLDRQRAKSVDDPTDPDRQRHISPSYGAATFSLANIPLALYGLSKNVPLSVLAVEMMPEDQVSDDPLGQGLGSQRILRTSNLVAVPHIC